MKLPLRAFALLLAALIISGCSKNLDVEVFIVTKGGQSVKLGLVEVKAVPFSEVAKIVKSAAVDPDVLRATAEANAKAVRDKNAPEVSSLNREVTAVSNLQTQTHGAVTESLIRLIRAKLEIEQAFDLRLKIRKNNEPDVRGVLSERAELKWQLTEAYVKNRYDDSEIRALLSAVESVERIFRGEAWAGFEPQREIALRAAADVKTAVKQIRYDHGEIARLMAKLLELEIAGRPESIPEKTPRYIFSRLPMGTVSSKTNADGHCVLTLPPGQWAIAARASRELSGGKEEYFWIVPAPDGERVILSNDNLLSEVLPLEDLKIAGFRNE
jgi:hypothetical protein